MSTESDLKNYVFSKLQEKGVGNAFFYKAFSDITDYSACIKQLEEHSESSVYNLAKLYNFGEFLESNKVSAVFIWEQEYPELLKQIFRPPVVLYYCGDIKSVSKNCISIVGTRRASDYGKKYSFELSSRFAEQGYTVISGLATGIDSAAHKGALQVKGLTAAVLAGEPTEAIPKSNSNLYREILNSGGCILSEYQPGTKIVPGMFVERNRLIAGLSGKTFVIEAAKKSGALTTAGFAFESNREVYAVPGRPDMPLYTGTNELIKNNIASILPNIEDFFAESMGAKKPTTKDFLKDLTDLEIEICKLLETESMHPEEIKNLTKFDFQTILNTCIMLEMKQKIYKNQSGQYSLNNI